jgi:hypothetical protein
MTALRAAPFDLGPMPVDWNMSVVDELVVGAPLERIFSLAANVDEWPRHLPHYRFVRFHERAPDGGGIVEMSANRPFGPLDWPTWWTSEMAIRAPREIGQGSDNDLRGRRPAIRFRHVRGVTSGMEVEWRFDATGSGTHVRIEHVWNGPGWPVIGAMAAEAVIGPVFVHGIAQRTLAGLARVAERACNPESQGDA